MVKCIYSSAWAHNLTNHCLAFMEVIRHAELIVEWSLWTIEHTNRSLDNSMQRFAHHGLRQAYNYTTMHCMPNAAHDGRNVALNYQVTCWRPKEPVYCLALFVHYNICIHCAHVSLHRSMCQLMAVYVYHFNIVCVCVAALLRRVPCTFTDFVAWVLT